MFEANSSSSCSSIFFLYEKNASGSKSNWKNKINDYYVGITWYLVNVGCIHWNLLPLCGVLIILHVDIFLSFYLITNLRIAKMPWIFFEFHAQNFRIINCFHDFSFGRFFSWIDTWCVSLCVRFEKLVKLANVRFRRHFIVEYQNNLRFDWVNGTYRISYNAISLTQSLGILWKIKYV